MDEQEIAKPIERIGKLIAEVERKSGESPWLKLFASTVQRIFSSSDIREKIKDKTFDKTEAYLKKQVEDLEHVVLHGTPCD